MEDNLNRNASNLQISRWESETNLAREAMIVANRAKYGCPMQRHLSRSW